MAGWSRRADGEHEVLFRIVALLVGFADMADLAPGLSLLRRRRLLTILTYGEAVGRDFIWGMVPPASAHYDEPEIVGDPALLAASFRVLALVLYTMLTSASGAGGAVERLTGGSLKLGTPCRRAPAPFTDTS